MATGRVAAMSVFKRSGSVAMAVAAGFLIALMASSQGLAEEKKSGIRGTITMRGTGAPVEKAHVYAYVGKVETRAAQFGIIGITDWVSHGSAEDGTYKLDLPPGEYYVLSRKRQSGLNYGPLSKGDWYDHKFVKEPTRIRKGKYVECNFELQMLMEPMFFQGLTALERTTDTGVRGRILDEKGQHIPGTFVIAYTNDDMQRVPDFASTLSDDEGNYTLYLPKGGRYWLAARFYAMKVPQRGEPFGRFEGTPDHSVQVEDGRFLEGIDIVLSPYEGDPPEGIKIH
ncbi:MAG: carboxypeptidase regulatory-like domain-containing protein [bacterium]|nr:MAG: carboxypeptidase regulatory-like domain-containing protein [bacterium]